MPVVEGARRSVERGVAINGRSDSVRRTELMTQPATLAALAGFFFRGRWQPIRRVASCED